MLSCSSRRSNAFLLSMTTFCRITALLTAKIVNLYAAYYASQRTGKMPHSPLDCIPGDGWAITKFERTSLGNDRPINRATIERNGSRQLVYYWYEERGKRITIEYWSKWYLLYDAITKNRSDGALVRLTTALRPGELEQDADARLQQFIHDLGSTLNGFLASAETAQNDRGRAKPATTEQHPVGTRPCSAFFVIVSAIRLALIVLSVILLVGCSSPEDRARSYFEHGMQLLSEHNSTKAAIELRNAVRLKRDLIEAWRALAAIDEANGDWSRVIADMRTIVELAPNDVAAKLKAWQASAARWLPV